MIEYYEISVPDHNDSEMRVSLDGEYYYFRTTWNERGGFWLLSIYDANNNLIIGMAKLVPGTIWNFFYQSSCGPSGIIGVQSGNESIGRNDFINGSAHLIYVPGGQSGL